jgi:hypothetical protein
MSIVSVQTVTYDEFTTESSLIGTQSVLFTYISLATGAGSTGTGIVNKVTGMGMVDPLQLFRRYGPLRVNPPNTMQGSGNRCLSFLLLSRLGHKWAILV